MAVGEGTELVLRALDLPATASPGQAVEAIRRLNRRVIVADDRFANLVAECGNAQQRALDLADALVNAANDLLDSHGINLLERADVARALAPYRARFQR